MKNKVLALMGLVLLISAVTSFAGIFPKPAIVQAPNEWTLKTAFDQPKQITVRLHGEKQAKRFWYVILTLTNDSPLTDAPFFPSCDLMTDTYQIVPAGKGVRKEVFNKIKNKHRGRYPFLQMLDYVDHKILQGEDNTVDVAIIWQDFDENAKAVTLFIAGLSNETKAVNHPILKDDSGKPVKFYLRKTLALDYTIGGDPKLRQSAGLRFKKKLWVMR